MSSEAMLGFAGLGFVGIVGILILVGIVWLTSSYESKHYEYPSSEPNSVKGRKPSYSTAFSSVDIFLMNARHNLDIEHHFSPTPSWQDKCLSDSTGVRVVAAVVNPLSGQSNDVTMLFCVSPEWEVTPANPEARYFAVRD